MCVIDRYAILQIVRYIILVLFSLSLISCGKNDKNGKVVAVRGDSTSYRGYNIMAEATSCAIPIDGKICTQETSPRIMANRNFAEICQSKGARAYDCDCEKEFLCSSKLEILTKGYDYNQRLVEDIPHSTIISCADSGTFDPEFSDELQESFRQKCEAAGHKAVLVGCDFKKYLCSSRI